MRLEQMTVSETWRWRLLTIWVVVFSVLTSYALARVHDLADENRDSLCALHGSRATKDRALIQLMKEGGRDTEKIEQDLETAIATLAGLGCPDES
jgi:hypothetical protein